jgi:PPOX class probable F420-dependent enzyme
MNIPEHIRAFLEQPRLAVLATINADGSPQLTVMWYVLIEDSVVLNMTRGLVKERNLRRDPRMAICVEDGPRYVTLNGRAEIIEDSVVQEDDVRRMATRYRGATPGRAPLAGHQRPGSARDPYAGGAPAGPWLRLMVRLL